MRTTIGLKVIAIALLLPFANGEIVQESDSSKSILKSQRGRSDEKLNRLIIGFKNNASSIPFYPAVNNLEQVDALNQSLDLNKPWFNAKKLNFSKSLSDKSSVVLTDKIISRTEMQHVLEEIRNDPTVAYAEIDERVYALGNVAEQAVTNDPYDSDQWFVKGPSDTWTKNGVPITTAGGANLDTDRSASFAFSGTTKYISVVDTGITPHPDLNGAVIGGYDFISSDLSARDNDGRDSDPLDKGDINYLQINPACAPSLKSTWHGTSVASLLIALENNAIGIAGIAPRSRVTPMRSLGTCGGFDSDTIAAINWSAGIPVQGVPNNPNPSSVINLSLGDVRSCSQAYQAAIDGAIAAGITVVAATGNEYSSTTIDSPASCKGVISVTSHDATGLRPKDSTGYWANIGPGTTISAPGKDIIVISNPNDGSTGAKAWPGSPADADFYKTSYGTSYSAPIVSGIVIRMLQVAPSLTPAEIKSYLVDTARAFVSNTESCATLSGYCGAGMVDGAAAIARAQTSVHPTSNASSSITQNAARGSSITLFGTAQAGRGVANNNSATTISTAEWTQISGPPATINQSAPTSSGAGPNGQPIVTRTATVTVPNGTANPNAISFLFRATDNSNRITDSIVSISMASEVPTPAITKPSSNEGMVSTAGALNLVDLLIFSVFILTLVAGANKQKGSLHHSHNRKKN